MISAAIVLATLGVGGQASAQNGCQPTITQPCAVAPDKKTSDKPGAGPAARRPDPGSDEPKDHSPRIKLDRDTEFKFGTGGVGIGRKF
jgi:hypothetical protein